MKCPLADVNCDKCPIEVTENLCKSTKRSWWLILEDNKIKGGAETKEEAISKVGSYINRFLNNSFVVVSNNVWSNGEIVLSVIEVIQKEK